MADSARGFVPSRFPELRKNLTHRRFQRKELVIRPGVEPEAIYFVEAGNVRLFITGANGKEFTISVLGPGDIFSGHTRCYGEAVRDVEVSVTSRQVFRSLTEENPRLWAYLIPILGECLSNTFDIIEGLAFKECSTRLAWFLLTEAEARGSATPAGVLLDIGLTTGEIASRIGATRQTTSTILNDMIRQKLLSRQGNQLLIQNLEALRRLSAS